MGVVLRGGKILDKKGERSLDVAVDPDGKISETGKKLEVKIRCSKRIDDAMEGLEPKYSKKVFRKCLKELENRGLTRIKKKWKD